MKFILSTLGIAGSVIALGLAGIAVAAPAGEAIAATHWDIAQQDLVREFSQGLGADIARAQPVLVAEPAAAPASADRPRERRTTKTKHFR